MKPFLKWAAIVLGVLVALIMVFAIVVVVSVNGRANTIYADTGSPVDVQSDADSLANGEHIWITRGCGDCHGEHGEGGVFIDDPAIGTLYAANLTSADVKPHRRGPVWRALRASVAIASGSSCFGATASSPAWDLCR